MKEIQNNTYNNFKINIIKDIFLRTINSFFHLKNGKKDLYNNEQIFLHKKDEYYYIEVNNKNYHFSFI